MWTLIITLYLSTIPYMANGAVETDKLSGDYKTFLINEFNAARQAINTCTAAGKEGNLPSPARALVDLTWDDRLATTAAIKAADCRTGHGFSDETEPDNWRTELVDGNNQVPGEIITSSNYATATIESLVYQQAGGQFIDGERNRYRYGRYGKFVNDEGNCWKDGVWKGEGVKQGNCGHYTSVIWERTTHFGCAWATGCGSGGGKKLVVCHLQGYGENGRAPNYIGSYPYDTGSYCTSSNDDVPLLGQGFEEDEDAASTQDGGNSARDAPVIVVVIVLVVMVCVLGGAGYWFYRRRQRGKVGFDDSIGIKDEDEEEMEDGQGKVTGDGDEETEDVQVEVEMELNAENRD